MEDDLNKEDGYNFRERKFKKPSNAYFLGYVDDDETPEMILKKFEELEKFEKLKCTPGGSNVMTQRQQEQLYNLTSSVMVQQQVQGDQHSSYQFYNEDGFLEGNSYIFDEEGNIVFLSNGDLYEDPLLFSDDDGGDFGVDDDDDDDDYLGDAFLDPENRSVADGGKKNQQKETFWLFKEHHW